MDAGRLTERILIEAPTETENALGEMVPSWQTVAERWARVLETPGREFLSGDYRAEERTVFQIYWTAIDSSHRVQWGGRTWRINSVTGTYRERYSWLHCVSNEGVN